MLLQFCFSSIDRQVLTFIILYQARFGIGIKQFWHMNVAAIKI